ncbi:MAG TPA: SUF system NifU family Fe-S cluster assembly protein [Phototrophicaceae bacterium]|nr:SUF system NifU family Fe-S cluster assembly protein [Phototrophicaceae bacterium]
MYDMYRENILDHAQNPRFPGVLSPADVDHEEHNPLCGDRLHLTLRLDDNHRVAEIAWDGEGCAISQATASMLAEEIMGKTLDEIRQLKRDDIFELIGFPLTINRMKCALLSLKTLMIGLYGLNEWEKHDEDGE